MVVIAAGAPARHQPIHRPAARLDVAVPGTLEGGKLGLGVEVLASAGLVAVRLPSILDQHFLEYNEIKTRVCRMGGYSMS